MKMILNNKTAEAFYSPDIFCDYLQIILKCKKNRSLKSNSKKISFESINFPKILDENPLEAFSLIERGFEQSRA